MQHGLSPPRLSCPVVRGSAASVLPPGCSSFPSPRTDRPAPSPSAPSTARPPPAARAHAAPPSPLARRPPRSICMRLRKARARARQARKHAARASSLPACRSRSTRIHPRTRAASAILAPAALTAARACEREGWRRPRSSRAYAAPILHDDGVEITADKAGRCSRGRRRLHARLSSPCARALGGRRRAADEALDAANVEYEAYWLAPSPRRCKARYGGGDGESAVGSRQRQRMTSAAAVREGHWGAAVEHRVRRRSGARRSRAGCGGCSGARGGGRGEEGRQEEEEGGAEGRGGGGHGVRPVRLSAGHALAFCTALHSVVSGAAA